MPEQAPQSIPTRGVIIKTEPRCKICTSPHRGEIEDLIALQQRRGSLDDGTRVTMDYIKALAPERWGFRLNDPNLTTHGTKHFKAGDPQVLANRHEDAKLQLQEQARRGEIDRVAADDYLEQVIGIAAAKIKADPNSVTVDHGLKAVAELTKRKSDDAQQRQFELAGLGLARALGVADKLADKIATPAPAALEPENAEVVEAEVVE